MTGAETNPRLAAALSYAARGWFVFPCLPRLKVPQGGSGGHNDATRDPERLRAWWRVNPNFNVAIATGPSNLFVADVDPAGKAAWEAMLAADPDLAKSVALTVTTPRGGHHAYMEGKGPTTASKLAQGIDTRGEGGYVLAPPSYVDDGKSKGRYEGDPASASLPPIYPPLLARLSAAKDRAPIIERVPEGERKWDQPEAITRARAWLGSLVAHGTLHGTYNVCCGVLEMGITRQTAFDLIQEHWNPHRGTPKTDEELRFRLRNAWTYGQETKGGKAERPIEETFAHLMTDDTPAMEPPKAQPFRFYPERLRDACQDLAPLEWLVDGLLPRTGVAMLFGPPKTCKTFVAQDLAMSIATGHGPNWWQDGDREPQTVIYLAGESPRAFKGKRKDAWLAARMVPGLMDKEQLRVVTGVPHFANFEAWKELIRIIKEDLNEKPALFVIDTLGRAMTGWKEQDSTDAGKAVSIMERVVTELDCLVLCIHHSGKDTERGARGSSVWLASVDTQIETERLDRKSLEVLLHVRAQKEGEEPENPLMMRGLQIAESLAFNRDWDFAPETDVTKAVKEQQDTEEWMNPNVIASILANGPMRTEHLVDSLVARFNVEKRIVGKKLRNAMGGRFKAWIPGEPGIWVIPATHPAMIKQEDF